MKSDNKPDEKSDDFQKATLSMLESDDQWLRHMSIDELASLGVNYMAYVKPITVDGVLAFGIFGADGEQIGLTPRRDMAFAAIREHDLEPLSVH